ncbi:hypothetical protein CPB83DRAFT_356333 [Crepidotus variabilis]|uniref:F-box domain-containing protein n=1 Tax=Crepidotus variabilis TaxID=179855 RepID=A0A9P6JPV8_9AGAR|nr:hypothetical protein CPB83DRAFT_356333 [Crepidotus variabilis]
MGHHAPRDLGFIMDLPTDLVYEILQHLHPIDLYTLVRTNKTLRALLLSKESYSTWRNSYTLHPDIPTCPADISYPKWTTLLFGPDECDKCGSNYAMPDIAFRANYCESCIMRNYMDKGMYPHVLESHPDHKDTLWPLLRFSYQWSGYTYFKGEFRKQYLPNDVTQREHEVTSFLKRIDADISKADREYRVYRWSRVQEVRAYMAHVESCNTWYMEVYRKVKDAHSGLSLRLATRCSRILVKRGFHPRDISSSLVQNALHASHITRLRGLRFRTVLKRIEVWVTAAARMRSADEKKDLLQKRQKLVDDTYHQYAMSRFSTDIWSSLPPAEVVRDLGYFKGFIESESDELGKLCQDRATAELDGFIETTFEKPKRGLTLASLLTNGKMKDYLGKGHPQEFDVLELATSVFSCPPCEAEVKCASDASAVVGWNELKNHLHCSPAREKASSTTPTPSTSAVKDKVATPLELPLRADKGGARDAISLLRLLALDPLTTTAEDMDKLDPRFLCMCCSPETSKGLTGRRAMGWRECLAHLHHMKLVTSQGAHYVPSWMLLTEEATRSVRYHENMLNPFPKKSSWSCKHCSLHFQKGVDRSCANDHVKNVHKIERPRQDIDFCFVPGKNKHRRKLFVVTLEPPVHYRCTKCPDAKSFRLWSLRPLQAHLADKHDIRENHDIGYISIDISQRTSEDLMVEEMHHP